MTKSVLTNSPKLSIIVPVFRVEQFLNKCVDSILNQTYRNLEVILVDDGSTDNCPRICDEYSQADPRVRVIHKKNGGLCSARNAGLDIATGEYVTFVDSDDWIEPDAYAEMIRISLDYRADITGGGTDTSVRGKQRTKYLRPNSTNHVVC